MQDVFHRPCDGGVELFVRLTPRAGRDAVEGAGTAADGRCHLKCRVRAVPEKGKANEALARLLAAALGVAPGAVSVVAGHTARLKTVRVAGDLAELDGRLRALVG